MVDTSLVIEAQGAVINQVRGLLEIHNRARVVISGASGSGKTWAARAVAQKLEKESGWKVVFCPCTEWGASQPYKPLDAGLARIRRTTLTQRGKRFAVEAVKDLPFVGNTTSAALNELIDAKRERRFDIETLLPDRAKELIFQLEALAVGKPLLVVVDDLQWIDRETSGLLRDLGDSSLRNAFGFLDNLRILATFATDRATQSPQEAALSIAISRPTVIALSTCSLEDYKRALDGFGLKALLDNDRVGALWMITGGHLRIAQHIVEFLNSDGRLTTTADSQAADVLRIALDQKLRAMGPAGAELRRVLEKAAIIGADFTVDELACLMQLDVRDIRKRLDQAEHERLVRRSGRLAEFSHEVVREYFVDDNAVTTRSDHEAFAECLRTIRPHCYGLRAVHQRLAGYRKEAVILEVLDALARFRDGLPFPGAELRMSSVQHAPELGAEIDLLERATRLFAEGAYAEVASLCEGIAATAPKLLAVEAAILGGRALIKSAPRSGQHRAIEILQTALAEIPLDELDLWGRCALYLIVALAHVNRIEEARALARRLARELEPREQFDPNARMLTARLRLRADMLYADDVAAAELNSALKILDVIGGDPVQTYAALCTASGNAIYRGAFEDALRFSGQADDLVKRHETLRFPRLDIAVNNQLVAAWVGGHLSAAEFATKMEQLQANAQPTNDTLLLRSNHAVAIALLGKPTEAAEVLWDAFAAVSRPESGETYDCYFIGNNLAGALYDVGNLPEARRVWSRLDSLAAALPVPIRGFMDLRHQVMTSILSAPPIEGVGWDDAPREKLRDRIGPMWRFFGRGFLLSELQFWSDE